jgi:hypothetical protein
MFQENLPDQRALPGIATNHLVSRVRAFHWLLHWNLPVPFAHVDMYVVLVSRLLHKHVLNDSSRTASNNNLTSKLEHISFERRNIITFRLRVLALTLGDTYF